jgi:hypothetical protein
MSVGTSLPGDALIYFDPVEPTTKHDEGFFPRGSLSKLQDGFGISRKVSGDDGDDAGRWRGWPLYDRRIETCWSIIPGLASFDYGNHHGWFIRCCCFQKHAY